MKHQQKKLIKSLKIMQFCLACHEHYGTGGAGLGLEMNYLCIVLLIIDSAPITLFDIRVILQFNCSLGQELVV